MANFLTLAVAGSRKTQSIVDYCASLPQDCRALVLTYTQANQAELRRRLRVSAGDSTNVVVAGWFTFLVREFARPFLPFLFPGQRVLGFNFDDQPHRFARGKHRFLDAAGAVYKCELGRLAHELHASSKGALLRRLECMYDKILLDEVQDLSSHDWNVLDVLLSSAIEVRMVGDVRQAVLSTNPRSAKNKRYAYADAINWFRERQSQGIIEISEQSTTWRCRPEIASFSDTIFDAGSSFPRTTSMNGRLTGHDGVYLVRSVDVPEYVRRYQPQCLRDSANSGKTFDLNFFTFGVAKGQTYDRVLIVPTAGITEFLQSGRLLKPLPAARFYVGITRAAQSVAIVLDQPGRSLLPYWSPVDGIESAQAGHL